MASMNEWVTKAISSTGWICRYYNKHWRYARRLVPFLDPFVSIDIVNTRGKESGQSSNDAYKEVEAYLTKVCMEDAHAFCAEGCSGFLLSLREGQEVTDDFRGVTVWWLLTTTKSTTDQQDTTCFRLMFPQQHRALILDEYLPHVRRTGREDLHKIMNLRHGVRLVKWGPHEWVLDSGAWNHHTSNLELLREGGDFQFQEMHNKDARSSGDDAAAPDVQGHGSVRTNCFDFPDVHYVVGDDTRNVVSVSQLARDHGLVTVFEPTSCHVKNKKTGKIIGKGRLCNGMYMLDSLRIGSRHIRDGGTSGGDFHDGADGGGGGNGDGDSTAEGRGGVRRYGRGGEGGTGARNQDETSGSGAAEGDVNETNEGEGGNGKETEEINQNDEDDIKEIGEINGKGEKEDDEKKGGQNSGQLSSHTGLFGMSRFDWKWWIVSILLCIAAFNLQPYTGWGAGVTIILPVALHSLVAEFWLFLFILTFILFKTWMSTICKEEETLVPHLQELSHQEQNKRLFGLSRFDGTTTCHLPAKNFAWVQQ